MGTEHRRWLARVNDPTLAIAFVPGFVVAPGLVIATLHMVPQSGHLLAIAIWMIILLAGVSAFLIMIAKPRLLTLDEVGIRVGRMSWSKADIKLVVFLRGNRTIRVHQTRSERRRVFSLTRPSDTNAFEADLKAWSDHTRVPAEIRV